MSTENERHPSIDFVMSLREDAERCELAASTGSAPSAAHRYREEISKRRVVVEDEWQTAEDHLDDGNLAEATYFLERMISETRKLKLTIEAAASQEPNDQAQRRLPEENR